MFSLISDLHLDLIKQVDMENVIDKIRSHGRGQPLVLAGDIASPHTSYGRECWQAIVENSLSSYSHIIVVMGNHEHYDGDLETTKDLLPKEVIVLDRDVWKHPTDGYSIAGCTLWSEIPNNLKAHALFQLNDFSHITVRGNKFTPNIYNALHQRDRKWLSDYIENNNFDDNIIVTHHAPLLNGGCSPERFMNKPTNHYFETDLSSLVDKSALWICGHTHHRNVIERPHDGKISRVVLNCLGYAHEHQELKMQDVYVRE